MVVGHLVTSRAVEVVLTSVQEVVKFLVLMIAMLLAKTIVILLAEVDVTSLVFNHVVAAVPDIVVMVVLEQWHYSKKICLLKITQTLGSLA